MIGTTLPAAGALLALAAGAGTERAEAPAAPGAPDPLLLTAPVEPAAPTAAPLDQHERYTGDRGWYGQIAVGATSTEKSDGVNEDIDFDQGWAVPVAVGYRFGANGDPLGFDLELEGYWSDQDLDDDDVVEDLSVLAVLLNGVLDFRLTQVFSVFVGGGIGLGWSDAGDPEDTLGTFDVDDGSFLAWQGKAGVRFRSSEDISWHLGYRFLNIDDTKVDDLDGDAFDESFDLETGQHVIELGVRFGASGT